MERGFPAQETERRDISGIHQLWGSLKDLGEEKSLETRLEGSEGDRAKDRRRKAR